MNIEHFNNEKDVILQYKKVATILEILSITKHHSNFKSIKTNKDMIKYMLNELGMEEFSESLLPVIDGIIDDLIYQDFPIYYRYLKKNNYIISEFNKNEYVLVIKILENYILKIICLESDDNMVKHGLDIYDGFIYLFTSKTKNDSVVYFPDFIFDKSIFPYLENARKNFNKDINSTNKKLNTINKKSNFIVNVDMKMMCVLKSDIFESKDIFLKKVQKNINNEIRNIIRKRYGLQYLDII